MKRKLHLRLVQALAVVLFLGMFVGFYAYANATRIEQLLEAYAERVPYHLRDGFVHRYSVPQPNSPPAG